MNRNAFTLVELLVVVGIMASMATLSIGSYFAVVRGMSDRGAIATATSAISLAQERACIDLVPTVVYFYNELVEFGNEDEGEDPIVAGVAVAVRRAGRLTRVNGVLLGDEFGDLDRVYGALEKESYLDGGDKFRLYRFNVDKMEYSSVHSVVAEDSIPCNAEQYIVAAPTDNLVENFKKCSDYVLEGGDSYEESGKLISYAFKVVSDDEDATADSKWNVGDAYGYEFVRVRLPDNYIFGNGDSDAPTPSSRVKIPSMKPIPLNPGIKLTDKTLEETVNISTRTASGKWRPVGSTKQSIEDI